MIGRDLSRKYNVLLSFFVTILSLIPYSLRLCLFILFRNLKGYFGIAIRYIIISTLAKKIGNNVCIKEGVYIYNIKELSIGDNVSIHPMCYIDAIGGISIGNNVSIAHNSSIISFNHSSDNTDIAIKYNPLKLANIIINDDVWIGCGVRIMAGVEICSRVIVGAGAVVTTSLKDHALYAGVPAKYIKSIK